MAASRSMKSVPPWTRGGLQGGSNVGIAPALPAAVAVVRSVADKHGTPTTPAVAVGPGIPSSTEEGSSSSREREPKPAFGS